MNDYVTDEQQVEALKKWWSENGRYLIAGIALGLALLFAWDWWKNYRDDRAMQASELYSTLTEAVENGSLEQAANLGERLRDKFSATPYAALGSLAVARAQAEKGKVDAAADNLQWAIDNAGEKEIAEVAALRKIRLLLAAGKLGEAEAMLKRDFPPAYDSLVEELRGDLFSAKGDQEAARAAYDRALLTAGQASEFLRLKRDALGKGEAPSDNAAS